MDDPSQGHCTHRQDVKAGEREEPSLMERGPSFPLQLGVSLVLHWGQRFHLGVSRLVFASLQ